MSIQLPASRHPAEDCAAAFEWLHDQATASDAVRWAGVAFDEWAALVHATMYRDLETESAAELRRELDAARESHARTAKMFVDMKAYADACTLELEELREQVKADKAYADACTLELEELREQVKADDARGAAS